MDADLNAAASVRPRESRADHGATPADRKAREAAESFESFFLAQVLETMFAGIHSDGPFGGGAAEGQWRSLLHEQYANAIAKAGGIGIADQIYRQIIQLQEANS